MGSTLARGLKEFITHKFSSLHPEDESVELYYSKKHEESPLTPILRVTVHEVDRPGRPARFQRFITGLVYRPSASQASTKLYINSYDTVFETRVSMYNINGIMRGIQGAQAAFRRATKIGPLTRLELIGDPGTFIRAATSDAPAFRRFLALRVKRELKRRARVTAAGATLRQRGVPRNVAELILRRVGRGGAARQ
jgi:hypothetical protein